MIRSATKLVFLFLGVIALGACNSSETSKTTSSEESNSSFVRPGSEGGNTSAYFSYVNPLDKPDTLIEVRSAHASLTQVHENYQTEDGLYGMREIDGPIIPAHDTLHFKKGGTHVMLIDLNHQLTKGDTVRLELNFKQRGEWTQKLPVKTN